MRSLKHRLTRADGIVLLRLGMTANILYYLFLASSIHLTGVAPASLIVGMLPLTVTLVGRRDHGALHLRRLILPLALIAGGIVCINLDVFLVPKPGGPDLTGRILGIAAAVGALASWTDYAVANARHLRRHPTFTNREWSLLSGVASGVLALGLLPFALLFPHAAEGVRPAGLFVEVSLAVAIGSSIIGNSFWNAASRYLPMTLSGQMIVFETVFALLYGFLYDARLPGPLEIAAIVLLLAGVCWSARLHAVDEPASIAPS